MRIIIEILTFVCHTDTKLFQVCFILAKSVLINDWHWPDIIYLHFLKTLGKGKPVQTCFEDLRRKVNIIGYRKKSGNWLQVKLGKCQYAHANVQWPMKIISDPKLVTYTMPSGDLKFKRNGECVELESVVAIF